MKVDWWNFEFQLNEQNMKSLDFYEFIVHWKLMNST